jgi:hypothetical protein
VQVSKKNLAKFQPNFVIVDNLGDADFFNTKLKNPACRSPRGHRPQLPEERPPAGIQVKGPLMIQPVADRGCELLSVTLGPASVVSEHEVNVNGSSSNRRVPLAVSQRRPDRLQHRLGSEPALPCYHHYPAVSYVYVDAIS